MNLGAGKKTREWNRVRAQLKARFERAGITRCEIRLPQCWKDNALSFAHAKKRRDLKPGELEVVCLACAACHTAIEGMSHEEMYKTVMAAIARRPQQP